MIKPPSQNEKDNTKINKKNRTSLQTITETEDAKRLEFSLIQPNP
jgi:hypothetical protein